MTAGVPPSRSRLPDRTANYAREFLSALFMSLRTAQIHDRPIRPTSRRWPACTSPRTPCTRPRAGFRFVS